MRELERGNIMVIDKQFSMLYFQLPGLYKQLFFGDKWVEQGNICGFFRYSDYLIYIENHRFMNGFCCKPYFSPVDFPC